MSATDFDARKMMGHLNQRNASYLIQFLRMSEANINRTSWKKFDVYCRTHFKELCQTAVYPYVMKASPDNEYTAN